MEGKPPAPPGEPERDGGSIVRSAPESNGCVSEPCVEGRIVSFKSLFSPAAAEAGGKIWTAAAIDLGLPEEQNTSLESVTSGGGCTWQ